MLIFLQAFKILVEGVCRLVDDNHFENEFNVCNKIIININTFILIIRRLLFVDIQLVDN